MRTLVCSLTFHIEVATLDERRADTVCVDIILGGFSESIGYLLDSGVKVHMMCELPSHSRGALVYDVRMGL